MARGERPLERLLRDEEAASDRALSPTERARQGTNERSRGTASSAASPAREATESGWYQPK